MAAEPAIQPPSGRTSARRGRARPRADGGGAAPYRHDRPAARRHRWVRWTARAWLSGVLAAAIALTLLLTLTPSVSDAPARVAARAREHHAGPALAMLPSNLATAVLAVEDHRFYHHPGIDVLALGRFLYGALHGQDLGGATIELQLAKLLYTPRKDTPRAVLERLGIALKFDHSYSKRDILLMYLNTAYFGQGAYGAAAAARIYFGRSVYQLDWPQAALLAGLLQAPVAYDPLVHPNTARARRYHVLQRLRAVGVLTAAQVAEYNAGPLEVAGSGGSALTTTAPRTVVSPSR